MSKNTSSGKTPEKIVKLLTEAVKARGQSAVARESGIALYSVQRYLKGIGYPTLATLDKLAIYFKMSVAELMGNPDVGNLPFLVDQFRDSDFVKCSEEEMEIHLFSMCLASEDMLMSLNVRPATRKKQLIKQAQSIKFTDKQLENPFFAAAHKVATDFLKKYSQPEEENQEK